jgi:transmembrane sensor
MRETHLNPRAEFPGGTLPEPIARVLEDPVDEPRVARMWRRIEERRSKPGQRVGMMVGWAAVGAAVAIVLLFGANLLLQRSATERALDAAAAIGPLLQRGGKPVHVVETSATTGAPIELADGSHITVGRDSRLEPLASSEREFVVLLARGAATFSVVPGGPRRWIIEAGLATVEVVGTVLTVTRTPDAVRVDVQHGIVLVRGATVPNGVARVESGQSIEVRASEPPALAAPGGAGDENRKARPKSTAMESWRDRAAHGAYRDAYGILGAQGLEREVDRAESAEELLTLSDVARLSGHPADAVAPLERLLDAHPKSPRAALAAVTLGRVELDLGHARRASAALERALALGVPVGLEEDVHVRWVEALVKSGNRAAADRAAAIYDERFPHGRRRADVDRWLAR